MIDFDATAYLKSIPEINDADLDLGALALAMVADDHRGVSLDRYAHHFASNRLDVAQRHKNLIEQGCEDDLGTRLAALKFVLSDTHDYRKTEPSFEVLESADIMRVIDLGKGGASALCLIYMDAARKNGWHVEGLDFPSHFLCRIEKDGQRLIFDPTHQCKVLEAYELRSLLKEKMGEGAELTNDYFEGLNGLDTVIHLGNRLKSRRIEMSDYKGALKIVERIRIIAPDRHDLLLDAGVLYARTGKAEEAVSMLEEYIEKAPENLDKQDAIRLLQELSEA